MRWRRAKSCVLLTVAHLVYVKNFSQRNLRLSRQLDSQISRMNHRKVFLYFECPQLIEILIEKTSIWLYSRLYFILYTEDKSLSIWALESVTKTLPYWYFNSRIFFTTWKISKAYFFSYSRIVVDLIILFVFTDAFYLRKSVALGEHCKTYTSLMVTARRVLYQRVIFSWWNFRIHVAFTTYVNGVLTVGIFFQTRICVLGELRSTKWRMRPKRRIGEQYFLRLLERANQWVMIRFCGMMCIANYRFFPSHRQ